MYWGNIIFTILFTMEAAIKCFAYTFKAYIKVTTNQARADKLISMVTMPARPKTQLGAVPYLLLAVRDVSAQLAACLWSVAAFRCWVTSAGKTRLHVLATMAKAKGDFPNRDRYMVWHVKPHNTCKRAAFASKH